MAIPRCFLVPVGIALAAFWGALRAMPPMAGAGTASVPACAARMEGGDGSCYSTLPAGGSCGSCCEPATPAGRSSDSLGPEGTIGQFSARSLQVEVDRSGGTCRCRSQTPAASIVMPDCRSMEHRSDLGPDTIAVCPALDMARGPLALKDGCAGPPARCSLYLLNSHLLI